MVIQAPSRNWGQLASTLAKSNSYCMGAAAMLQRTQAGRLVTNGTGRPGALHAARVGVSGMSCLLRKSVLAAAT